MTLLGDAAELIAGGWTQHADARTADGAAADPWDAGAVSWSLLGALVASFERMRSSAGRGAALSALATACVLLADVIDSDSLPAWNDAPERRQQDVIAALHEATAREESRPPPAPGLN